MRSVTDARLGHTHSPGCCGRHPRSTHACQSTPAVTRRGSGQQQPLPPPRPRRSARKGRNTCTDSARARSPDEGMPASARHTLPRLHPLTWQFKLSRITPCLGSSPVPTAADDPGPTPSAVAPGRGHRRVRIAPHGWGCRVDKSASTRPAGVSLRHVLYMRAARKRGRCDGGWGEKGGRWPRTSSMRRAARCVHQSSAHSPSRGRAAGDCTSTRRHTHTRADTARHPPPPPPPPTKPSLPAPPAPPLPSRLRQGDAAAAIRHGRRAGHAWRSAAAGRPERRRACSVVQRAV